MSRKIRAAKSLELVAARTRQISVAVWPEIACIRNHLCKRALALKNIAWRAPDRQQVQPKFGAGSFKRRLTLTAE